MSDTPYTIDAISANGETYSARIDVEHLPETNTFVGRIFVERPLRVGCATAEFGAEAPSEENMHGAMVDAIAEIVAAECYPEIFASPNETPAGNFVRLTGEDGQPIYFSSRHVVAVGPRLPGKGTLVVAARDVTNGMHIGDCVVEPLEEVVSKLEEALRT